MTRNDNEDLLIEWRDLIISIDQLTEINFWEITATTQDEILVVYSPGKKEVNKVEVLLHKGIHPNTRIDGRTPLDIVCEKGRADVVDVLVKHGADMNNDEISMISRLGRCSLHVVMGNSCWLNFCSIWAQRQELNNYSRALLIWHLKIY
eukprot:Phypoly_transcript_14272.p1 GENE.Phypoly_transcript_14272~~Phypoly_transcript_14272.p1  ORF type:complete len:149 (+),score=14.35 Phypoly_transcript_14272:44-490(+)